MWPDEGMTYDHIQGVLGILLYFGRVKYPGMKDDWSLDKFYGFPLVRKGMKRDFFFMVYSRFLHIAVTSEAEGDKLHHIR